MDSQKITVELYRSHAPNQEPQFYEVPYEHRHSVLTVLQYIYENQDPTVSFRHYQCGRGICNSCRMNINGRPRKACATVVQPGEHIVVRPYNEAPIRDLVTIIGSGPPDRADSE